MDSLSKNSDGDGIPAVDPANQPYRNRGVGRLLQLLGVLIGFFGMIIVFGSARYQEALDMVLIGLFAIAGGYFLWFRGTRIRSVPGELLLLEDRRAPVVFIRSFGDEQRSYSAKSLFLLVWRALSDLKFENRYYQAGTSFWGPVMQFQCNRLFSEIGPFVAIGRPGEKIPGMGAARMYVPDDQWQSVVSDLFGRSRLVVVQPGTTPGLRWEIGQLRREVSPEKLLFVLPEKEVEYQAFRSWIDRELPVVMPESMPSSRFLAFDSEWKPFAMGGYRMMLGTLEPYLRQNGIHKSDFSWQYRLVYNSWIFTLILTAALLVLLFGMVAVLFP